MSLNKSLKWLTLFNYFLIVWLLKSSLSELPFTFFRPRIKPPISTVFINISFNWNGEKWKIKVVGTININRRYKPNLCLNPDIKSIKPKTKQMMAINNKNWAKVGDIFLLIITSRVSSKFIIFPGIAYINIADINILSINFLFVQSSFLNTREWKIYFYWKFVMNGFSKFWYYEIHIFL